MKQELKILYLGGEISGGGASKILYLSHKLFNKSYIGGISEDKLDINFLNSLEKTGIQKIINVIFSYQNYKKLSNFLKKNDINIVHLHNFNGTVSSSILLALLKYKKKIKIVQTLHDYNLICPNSSLYNYRNNSICEKCLKKNIKYNILIQNCAIKGLKYSVGKFMAYLIYDKLLNQKKIVDLFITPSLFTKEKIEEDKVNSKKIKVVANPVENFFEQSNEIEKENLIVYFGRFSKEKNIIFLLKCFSNVLKKKNDIKLLLIGSGNERNKYLKKIKELGIEKKVEIQEFLKPSELVEKVKKAKISVLPSTCYETFGLTIIESLYAKVYPITNNIGAMRENIIENVGKTFNNEIELENLIIDIMENYDTEYKAQLNERYYDIVKKHNLFNYKKSLEKIYLNLLEE